MANALQKEMANNIASLVRKQTFSGSGVWRQSGNATLRIQNQTNSIVEALTRLPSKEEQEEEEREDDRQHAELVGALKGDGSGGETKKKGGLLGGLMAGIGKLGKGLAKPLKGLFGFLGSITKIFAAVGGFLLKPIKWAIGGAGSILAGTLGIVKTLFFTFGGLVAAIAGLGLAKALGFDPKNEEEAKKYFDKEVTTVNEEFALFMGTFAKDLVSGLTSIYNSIVPDDFKLSDDTIKKIENFTLDGVTNSVKSLLDFSDEIVKSFKDGITPKFDGIKQSFDEFKTSVGKVVDKFTKSDAKSKVKGGILGVVKLVGSAIGNLTEFLLDLGTGIANLITNPTETLARVQIKIEGFFIGIADTIGRMFDEFFNMENFLKIVESMGVPIPDQMLASAAGKRIREKQNEIEKLDKLDKTLQQQADDAKIKLAKEQEKGDEANEKTLRNLSLSITAAEEQIKRNQDIRTYNKEQITESAKTAAQELKNQKIKKVTGLDLQKKEEELQEIKEDSTAILEKEITGGRDEWEKTGFFGGESIKGTVAEFQGLRDLMRRQFGMNIEQGQEMRGQQYFDVVKGGVTTEFIKSDEGQRFISELASSGLLSDQGIKFGREKTGDDSFAAAAEKINLFLFRGLRQQRKIDALSDQQKDINDEIQEKIKSVEPALERKAMEATALKFGVELENLIIDEKQTGGRISQTGLYKLHAGEIVFDPPSSDRIDNFVASYLPQSGTMINQLQMDRTMGGTTGSAAPVVIDNSQQPTIINQTNVAAPQTRGPALVGEGRDKVNMK